jgi:hypothetical protein
VQRLGRVHRLDAELPPHVAGKAMVLAQLPAHLGQQRVLLGTRQVGDADLRRVELPASRAAGHQRQARVATKHDHRHLHAHRVDGVDHVIEAGTEEFGGVVDGHEIIDHRHHAGRVDPGDALAHGLDLGLAERRIAGVNLAVDVRLGHMIEVDQGQMPHPAARQRLGRPRAHAANAHHAHPRRRQPGPPRLAIQAGNATKAAGINGGGDFGGFHGVRQVLYRRANIYEQAIIPAIPAKTPPCHAPLPAHPL